MLRLMAFVDRGGWDIWTEGYAAILARLEAGDQAGALACNEEIYRRYRARIESLPFPDDEPV